jgi:hypothetical protein
MWKLGKIFIQPTIQEKIITTAALTVPIQDFYTPKEAFLIYIKTKMYFDGM